MLKKTVQGLMALTATVLITVGAQARDIRFDVFALGGASTLFDVERFDSAGRLYDARYQYGPKFSIGVAVPYGKLLSIETAYSGGPNNLFLTNLNVFPHAPVEYPVNIHMGTLSAVFHAPFTFHHWRPYAEGGIEYDRFSPTTEAIQTAKNVGFGPINTANLTYNNKFGVNVGLGLDRKIMKRLTFRIDLRDHITGSPAYGLPPEATLDSAATFPVSGHANNVQYTAGFLVHLGKL